MPIVYIGLSYYPPQIWKIDILKISNEASKTGARVTVFVKGKKWEQNIEKIWNTTIYRLLSRWEFSLLDEFIYLFSIPYILFRDKIPTDIFHIYNPFFLVSILQIILRILYPRSRIIFDIRTWPLKEWFKKTLNYFLITLGHITASKTIVIHKNLLNNFFYIKRNSVYELALWFDPVISSPYQKESTQARKYIYIGSIYPRREIVNMLKAFERYLCLYPSDTLTILGWWDPEYVTLLREQYSSDHIHFVGTVEQDAVQQYLNANDYWVAYIPMRSYFMDQPPLKTIEYLGSGLPVIWTQTAGNQLFVQSENGVLASDSPEEFLKWLILFRKTFTEYNTRKIQKSVEAYEWKNIYTYLEKTVYHTMSLTEKDLEKTQIYLNSVTSLSDK